MARGDEEREMERGSWRGRDGESEMARKKEMVKGDGHLIWREGDGGRSRGRLRDGDGDREKAIARKRVRGIWKGRCREGDRRWEMEKGRWREGNGS